MPLCPHTTKAIKYMHGNEYQPKYNVVVKDLPTPVTALQIFRHFNMTAATLYNGGHPPAACPRGKLFD